MAISASMVKELREKTGAGMMDCKKALSNTDGDMDKAVEWLRENGLAKAEKKAGRIAAEGIVKTNISEDGKKAAIVEVNSETDFVAKNEKFQDFVAAVADQVNASSAADIDAFLAEPWAGDSSKTVKEELASMVATIGENMNIRRFEKVTCDNGIVVDYIHAGGKIGVLIAAETDNTGAEVVLVCGPVNLKTCHSAIRRVDVESAAQMYEVTSKEFVNSDVAVLSAAVADFTPKEKADHKIKRGKDDLLLELLPTKDIAAELGRIKTASQLLIGFALETNDEEINALSKMQRKNLDMIVLNSLNDKGAGFSVDTNKVTILDKAGDKTVYELKTKVEVAKDIVDQIASRL